MKKTMKSIALLLSVVLLFGSMATSALACTSMAAGKDATTDGSVLISHTCDGWYDNRIQIVPGATYEEGAMVDIYRDPCYDTNPGYEPKLVGQIPQVEKTNTYFNIGYPFMNDKQVMMGEHTWSGRVDVRGDSGLFVIANLQMLALQRADTAREACEIMGALALEYGYADGGEAVFVGDENEAWIFEICGPGPLWTPESGLPGAHWVARRVPDDSVHVGANRSRTGVVDFEDTENFIVSKDITKMPIEMGWYKEGEEFNFSEIFHPVSPTSSAYICSRREWRAFDLIAPSLELPVLPKEAAYPFTVKPDEKISAQTIMNIIYRDHYEGTPYSMTEGPDSGAFGNPVRFGVKSDQKTEDMVGYHWERSIATSVCSYSFVSQSRSWLPDEIGGVLWFGQDSPDTTVYVPLYCGITEVPRSWSEVTRDHFDKDTAWWAFNFVNNWAQLRWNAMYEVISEEKAKLEGTFFDNQDAFEASVAKLYETDKEAAIEKLTQYSNNAMMTVEAAWWKLAGYLVGGFYDGRAKNDDGKYITLGYTTEYLEEVGYGAGQSAEHKEFLSK